MADNNDYHADAVYNDAQSEDDDDEEGYGSGEEVDDEDGYADDDDDDDIGIVNGTDHSYSSNDQDHLHHDHEEEEEHHHNHDYNHSNLYYDHQADQEDRYDNNDEEDEYIAGGDDGNNDGGDNFGVVTGDDFDDDAVGEFEDIEAEEHDEKDSDNDDEEEEEQEKDDDDEYDEDIESREENEVETTQSKPTLEEHIKMVWSGDQPDNSVCLSVTKEMLQARGRLDSILSTLASSSTGGQNASAGAGVTSSDRTDGRPLPLPSPQAYPSLALQKRFPSAVYDVTSVIARCCTRGGDTKSVHQLQGFLLKHVFARVPPLPGAAGDRRANVTATSAERQLVPVVVPGGLLLHDYYSDGPHQTEPLVTSSPPYRLLTSPVAAAAWAIAAKTPLPFGLQDVKKVLWTGEERGGHLLYCKVVDVNGVEYLHSDLDLEEEHDDVDDGGSGSGNDKNKRAGELHDDDVKEEEVTSLIGRLKRVIQASDRMLSPTEAKRLAERVLRDAIYTAIVSAKVSLYATALTTSTTTTSGHHKAMRRRPTSTPTSTSSSSSSSSSRSSFATTSPVVILPLSSTEWESNATTASSTSTSTSTSTSAVNPNSVLYSAYQPRNLQIMVGVGLWESGSRGGGRRGGGGGARRCRYGLGYAVHLQHKFKVAYQRTMKRRSVRESGGGGDDSDDDEFSTEEEEEERSGGDEGDCICVGSMTCDYSRGCCLFDDEGDIDDDDNVVVVDDDDEDDIGDDKDCFVDALSSYSALDVTTNNGAKDNTDLDDDVTDDVTDDVIDDGDDDSGEFKDSWSDIDDHASHLRELAAWRSSAVCLRFKPTNLIDGEQGVEGAADEGGGLSLVVPVASVAEADRGSADDEGRGARGGGSGVDSKSRGSYGTPLAEVIRDENGVLGDGLDLFADDDEAGDDGNYDDGGRAGHRQRLLKRSWGAGVVHRDGDGSGVASQHAQELWMWGTNEYSSLGLPASYVACLRPTTVNLHIIPTESVVCIACSNRHTLIVTSYGGMYAAGDGHDGALGLGTLLTSTEEFRPVTWFEEHHSHPHSSSSSSKQASSSSSSPSSSSVPPSPSSSESGRSVQSGRSGTAASTSASAESSSSSSAWLRLPPKPITVVYAAAGADLIGAHSLAIDDQGRLYTWGVGPPTGQGTVKAGYLPQEVPFFKKLRENSESKRLQREQGGRGGRGGEEGVDDDDVDDDVVNGDGSGVGGGGDGRILTASCGGGFTVAVTTEGMVYSWGAWARGRLGLGKPPQRVSSGRKRVLRFQLVPRRVYLEGKPEKSTVAGTTTNSNAGSRAPGHGGAFNGYSRGGGGGGGGGGGSVLQSDVKVVQLACGAYHCLAVTRSGRVYSWGHNGSGQLGYIDPPPPRPSDFDGDDDGGHSSGGGGGSGTSLLLRDAWTPHVVAPFTATLTDRAQTNRASVEVVRAIHVACGAAHSVVVDSKGGGWTWGGEGSSWLGLGDLAGVTDGGMSAAEQQARMMGLIGGGGVSENSRMDATTMMMCVGIGGGMSTVSGAGDTGAGGATSAAQGQAVAGGGAGLTGRTGEEIDLKSVPMGLSREVEQLRAVRVKAMGWATPRRVTALSAVQLVEASCGEQHTAFVTKDRVVYLAGSGPVLWGCDSSLGEREGLFNPNGEERLTKRKTFLRSSDVQQQPELPQALSLLSPPEPVPREPCSSWLVELAGKRVTAVSSGGRHIMMTVGGESIGRLLGRSLYNEAMQIQEKPYGDIDGVSAITGVGGLVNGIHDEVAVDCVLMVAGSYLYAHKVILARRSTILRDMILVEERPGAGLLLELLLPDLRYKVAKVMLEYLYTDNVTADLHGTDPLTHDLMQAARTYNLPRLWVMCRAALTILHADDPSMKEEVKIPQSTIAADFGGALGEIDYADVKFIADGKSLYAHSCILSARSEFFSAMFKSGMQEGLRAGNAVKQLVEVVVPDSYIGILRLLLYLYSGQLTSVSTENVLEDLMTADRYRLEDMKRLCESMVHVTAANCLEVAKVADMAGACRLRMSALAFLSHHLGEVVVEAGPAYEGFMSENPSIAKDLLARLHTRFCTRYSCIQQRKILRKERQLQLQEARKSIPFADDTSTPWFAILIVIAITYGYSQMANIMAIGLMVPIVNGVFFLGLAFFMFNKLTGGDLGFGKKGSGGGGGGAERGNGRGMRRGRRGGRGVETALRWLFG